jgi:hypothetical protein
MGFEITDLTINRCMLDKLYNTVPLLGLKLSWVSEITWKENYFVDELLLPYALWHHKHFLKRRKAVLK